MRGSSKTSSPDLKWDFSDLCVPVTLSEVAVLARRFQCGKNWLEWAAYLCAYFDEFPMSTPPYHPHHNTHLWGKKGRRTLSALVLFHSIYLIFVLLFSTFGQFNFSTWDLRGFLLYFFSLFWFKNIYTSTKDNKGTVLIFTDLLH